MVQEKDVTQWAWPMGRQRRFSHRADVAIVALTVGLAVVGSHDIPARAPIFIFILVLIGGSSRFSNAAQETTFFMGLAYCAMLGNSRPVQFPLATVFDTNVLLRPGLLILAAAMLVPGVSRGSVDADEIVRGAVFPVFVSWVSVVTAISISAAFVLLRGAYVLETEWLLTALANCLVVPCAFIICRRNMTDVRRKTLRKMLCAGLALVACEAMCRGWLG